MCSIKLQQDLSMNLTPLWYMFSMIRRTAFEFPDLQSKGYDYWHGYMHWHVKTIKMSWNTHNFGWHDLLLSYIQQSCMLHCMLLPILYRMNCTFNSNYTVNKHRSDCLQYVCYYIDQYWKAVVLTTNTGFNVKRLER